MRNRVTPLGELIASPARGLVYGNRGCLHDREGRIRREFVGQRWIACRLQFRGRRRSPLMTPGRYTELFFLDDATALAAGHRPCAECRRPDYEHVVAVWEAIHPGQRGAEAIDARLHTERLIEPGGKRRVWSAQLDSLPNGTFVLRDGQPWLVLGAELLRWSSSGYRARITRPSRTRASVITPRSLVALLSSDWTPLVPRYHPSAA